MDTLVYGRELELGVLANRVLPMSARQNLPVLACVYGARGMGKSALVSSFVAEAIRRQKHPMIVFKPDVSAGATGLEHFVESMFHSALVCPEACSLNIEQHANQFLERFTTLRRNELSEVISYSARGRVRSANGSDSALAGDTAGTQLAELFLESLTKIAEEIARNTENAQLSLCVLICLDEFSEYVPLVRHWIASFLIKKMLQSVNLTVPRILLTGTESMESSGQIDYWQRLLGEQHKIVLGPLDRSSCIKWLVDKGIQPDLIDDLMERTKGVPSEISRLLSDKTSIEALRLRLRSLKQ